MATIKDYCNKGYADGMKFVYEDKAGLDAEFYHRNLKPDLYTKDLELAKNILKAYDSLDDNAQECAERIINSGGATQMTIIDNFSIDDDGNPQPIETRIKYQDGEMDFKTINTGSWSDKEWSSSMCDNIIDCIYWFGRAKAKFVK